MSIDEIKAFVEEWTDGPEQNKRAFSELKEHLSTLEGTILDFLPRPGVTYSLRAGHPAQKERSLFVMVDVIEDSPRWLSVCFYADMIADPEEKGDFVPGGLLGQDACCFDINSYDADGVRYIKSRMDEAYAAASR